MADSDRPKKGLDATASINAFLSKIPQAGKSRFAAQHTAQVADKVDKLNVTENGTKANSNIASTISSTVPSLYASPQSKASDSVPPEKMTEWLQTNAPADHFKSKNPLLENVQSQATPHGSPQATGVLAPPPTPETISNLTIGQMISDELDKIPANHFTLLSESRFAPKNYHNRLSTAPHSSSTSFFSPVPRSTKPRDDSGFTRMSFKAADTPTIPAFVNPIPSASATEKLFFGQGPLSAVELKQSLGGGHANGGSSHTTTPVANGTKTSTLDSDNTKHVAPHLKPAAFAETKAPKVCTPDTPDEKADDEQKEHGGVRLPLQPLRPQANSFSPTNLTRPRKEEGKATIEEAAAAAAKPAFRVKPYDLSIDTSGDTSGGPLTPSSMIFTAVSPTRVREAGITTADSEPAKIVEGNLEGALYFKAWPKGEERASRSAAKHRKIVLTGLPRNSSPTFVASLVYGGPLESIAVGPTHAFVTFLRAEDAMVYYDATGNGLLYKKDGIEYVILTELGKDVDPASGVLREWTEKEFTRCVRAVGVDKEWSMESLHETAARKGRKVEKIIDGANVNKMRSVIFRFCEIGDAVKFKQKLNRAEEWEDCNVHYASDP
ncbi:MAG: hypothetical protein Q9211_000680 [Gyalolechia sp. 1 TL-2023]